MQQTRKVLACKLYNPIYYYYYSIFWDNGNDQTKSSECAHLEDGADDGHVKLNDQGHAVGLGKVAQGLSVELAREDVLALVKLLEEDGTREAGAGSYTEEEEKKRERRKEEHE
jgi:hypothetical protein